MVSGCFLCSRAAVHKINQMCSLRAVLSGARSERHPETISYVVREIRTRG